MSGEHDRADSSSVQGSAVLDRRRLMQALGAGTAATALGTNTVAASTTMQQDELSSDRSGEGIHPVFGFAALSTDVDPPVEPDHVVEAEIRPRDDREIPEFFFEPTGLYIEPGETVRFDLVSPHHSVTAYHPAYGTLQRIPNDVSPLSSPVLPVDAYWLYTFDQPGVYDLHCGPHELFGDVIRIVAGEATGPGMEPIPEPVPMPDPDADPGASSGASPQEYDAEANGDGDEEGSPAAETELRPPAGAALTVLGDPAIDPNRIVEVGQVAWDEIDDANKQIRL